MKVSLTFLNPQKAFHTYLKSPRMILLTISISHFLLASNPLCIISCYTNFTPLACHEGIWCVANSSYLLFKFKQTNYWGCSEPNISIILAAKQLYWQGRVVVGIHWSVLKASKKLLSSFWEKKNKTAQLHCITPRHWFSLPNLRVLIRSLTVFALLYSWNRIRVSWLTPIN